ncbi:GNAT family N-acetyltransferase [Clostridium algidicarnis]|uniref:GNAT family acetyltransferase n=2 Tax=Clostridium putrefaciens TaxID=99675 RepID=A0A381JBN6_9CLOT|nr:MULTISPECIES: GNAT family N-acetyltransferase [Clostridium]MBU3196739.1 GNAT family N-acetyltransferase [Clostridium algidicarnis]MBU3227812.1 GNAT family N-acetyltransferase [Clostridium algidicarnis]MBU3251563.1 GNAT family N-acetyltransferase [Clostridium algidicarnis]SUY48168.1 GNAT family acetyltransferase [Clostridium putrefaciens]
MYVKDKNRGPGIGTAFIEEFKRWCKSVNAKYIDLTVLVDNCSAIELYRKQWVIALESYAFK